MVQSRRKRLGRSGRGYGRDPSGRRAEAIQTLATLIGGMMLARTASDERRHEILEALKASLL
jgi:hypothetical protein